MAYAPRGETPTGQFTETEYGNVFEFGQNVTGRWLNTVDWPHVIWVCNRRPAKRFARVLKTVAYVVTDNDENGEPVVEKWSIKRHMIYQKD